ncbi:MAG: cytidylate kinase-like family protein [Oscillospiraceae bacterium]|nr:cytidylate kinase-like family protein [Oscillospiraceae bacterium]MBR7073868.1 cytidylate kinase-like family protein [Oscillospiraceae bacterium]
MIITIGRQHGSNGHAVAETLAKRLNIPCYSKEIVDRTARDSNFSHEVIRSYDEKRISPFIAPSTHFFGMDEGFRLNMQIASAQFEAIRSLADEGDAVFVGRCADYVLRSREDLVRVFLMADMPYRIKTVMERKNLTPEQAKKLIREVDKDRSSYYRYYTDQTWGESGCYDLCLNVGRVGIEGAAESIEAFIKAIK